MFRSLTTALAAVVAAILFLAACNGADDPGADETAAGDTGTADVGDADTGEAPDEGAGVEPEPAPAEEPVDEGASPDEPARAAPDAMVEDTAEAAMPDMAIGALPAPAGGAELREGLTVTGTGQAHGEPDTAHVMVGVNVQRDDAQTAIDDANAATEAVIAALDDAGVAGEDRRTRDFSVFPFRHHGPRGEVEETRYGVRNMISATVRNVDQLGALLQTVTEAAGGDASIEGITFGLEDDTAQVADARRAAVDDAREKAEEYADLAGLTLGDLVAIEDHSATRPRTATPEDAAVEAEVPIEPGQQTVTVQVRVRWSID